MGIRFLPGRTGCELLQYSEMPSLPKCGLTCTSTYEGVPAGQRPRLGSLVSFSHGTWYGPAPPARPVNGSPKTSLLGSVVVIGDPAVRGTLTDHSWDGREGGEGAGCHSYLLLASWQHRCRARPAKALHGGAISVGRARWPYVGTRQRGRRQGPPLAVRPGKRDVVEVHKPLRAYGGIAFPRACHVCIPQDTVTSTPLRGTPGDR